MEYYEELEYWYKDGYYYDINTKFACPLMKDLVMQFQGYDIFFNFLFDPKIENIYIIEITEIFQRANQI